MAKNARQQRRTTKFRLCKKSQARLNRYLSEIRKGIVNVCELHTHDSAPSMSKETFETTFIDSILGQATTAVSVSIRAMTEGLQAQKEKEVLAAMRGAAAPAENKEED